MAPAARPGTDGFAPRHGPGRGRAWALAGPAAAALFAGSLLGFAAARTDGYTHGTKAVSELGAAAAPHAAAFNLLAFVLPGVLVVALAGELRRATRPAGSRTGPALLALSGAALVVTGAFPVDMADRASARSVVHLVGAMLVGLFWAAGLFWLGPLLDRHLGLRTWGRLTPWLGLAPLTNVAWQVAWQAGGFVLPGWGQRIGFAGYFFWVALTGLAVGGRQRRGAAGEDAGPGAAR